MTECPRPGYTGPDRDSAVRASGPIRQGRMNSKTKKTPHPLVAKAIALAKIVVPIGFAAGIGIQFVPVPGVGQNPQPQFQFEAPPEVKAILVRSCLDCHSNETRWPFTARLAPASWLIMKDVEEGRGILNFSEWADYDEEDRAIDKESAWEQIEAGTMPPWFYYPPHPDAWMSDSDKAILKKWMMPEEGADAKADDTKAEEKKSKKD